MLVKIFRDKLLDEKGASIIETLVALGFIGVVSTSFLNLAITARKISFRHRVENELGRYAGIIAEEVVKDYTLDGASGVSLDSAGPTPSAYCSGGTGLGTIIVDFLNDLDGSTCSVTEVGAGGGNYKIILTGNSFGKTLQAERSVILK